MSRARVHSQDKLVCHPSNITFLPRFQQKISSFLKKLRPYSFVRKCKMLVTIESNLSEFDGL